MDKIKIEAMAEHKATLPLDKQTHHKEYECLRNINNISSGNMRAIFHAIQENKFDHLDHLDQLNHNLTPVQKTQILTILRDKNKEMLNTNNSIIASTMQLHI